MSIYYGYSVIEIFDDQAPEPFGGYSSQTKPKVGDEIQLRWLDGREAHRVIVDRVNEHSGTLYVRAIR